MSIWRPKKDVLFQVAKSKVSALTNAINSGQKPELEQNKFFQIIPKDPKSPLIMGMGPEKHLIYYPKNSTPYIHAYEAKIKSVEVIEGQLIDKQTGKLYKKGDKINIFPHDKVEPYTLQSEAYVMVSISLVESIFDQICP